MRMPAAARFHGYGGVSARAFRRQGSSSLRGRAESGPAASEGVPLAAGPGLRDCRLRREPGPQSAAGASPPDTFAIFARSLPFRSPDKEGVHSSHAHIETGSVLVTSGIRKGDTLLPSSRYGSRVSPDQVASGEPPAPFRVPGIAAAGGGWSEVKRRRAGSPRVEPRTESPSEAAEPGIEEKWNRNRGVRR
jgi:hypothetical protein